MSYAQAAAAYQRNAVLTASPDKLVKLLYEGAIRNLEQSRVALSDATKTHSAEAGMALSRALGIIGELRASLDHAVGGQMAGDLDRLYDFTLDQISQANVSRKPEGVNNALRVMKTLKEGWDAIIPT
jgi:flagellar secretion chaperone FliS